MHSITLNICACILLLSSAATITILLRKRFRQWKSTPLYVLSMSDVLFSMFTCTVLFVNCMEQMTRDTNSTHLTIDDESVKNRPTDYGGSKTSKDLNAATNLNGSDIVQDECDITNAIIEYGTLFLPFTNSFVSLLMFSVRCNLNVFDLRDECYEFMRSESDQHSENLKGSREIPNIERRNTLETFKRGKTKRGVTAAFVLSQWIVPVFVTGLLYLANFDENSTKEAARCSTESVFLFDDCIDLRPTIVSQVVDSETHENPVYTDHFDEEHLKLKESNSSQLNEIIFKVQNLVYSLINNSSTISFDRVSYNSSDASNTTRYFELDTYTILLERNESIENDFDLANSSWAEHGSSGDSSSAQEDTNFINDTYSGNYTNKDDEYSFFNDLMMNISYIVQEETYDNEITTDIVEKLYINESQTSDIEAGDIADDSIRTTVKYDPPLMSNDQIYAEILKRIHNVPAYNKYHKNKDYEKKQPKEYRGTYSEHSSALNEYVSSNVNATIYQQDDSSVVKLVHIADNCFISIQFVKVHLLLLALVIYFLPILFSSILQRRGKSICKIMLEKLEARSKASNGPNSDFTCEIDDESCELSMHSTGTSASKRPDKNRRHSIPPGKLQFVKMHEDRDKSLDEGCKNNRFDENQQSIINRMENVSKSFDTIRKSTLCGTILWTPLFLEFLVKVFVSPRVPEWSLNVAYLTATLFGTLRNIFNIKMIKYQEANTGITKINSVHPAT